MSLRVQAAGNQGAGTQLNGVQAGDLLTVCVRERDGDALSVSDDVNGSWGAAIVSAPLTVGQSKIFAFRNSAAGNPTVSVTGGTVRDWNAAAWIGYQTGAGVFDVTGSVTNSATTSQTHDDSGITPSASALILTAWTGTQNVSQSVTPHSGFTALTVAQVGGDDRQYYAYKEAHTGSINPTHTTGTSITTDACCAAFLALAGGGGGGGIVFNLQIG